MKLAEALNTRADLQRRVQELRHRLTLSVVVQEGEAAPEDPRVLIAEVERLTRELGNLIPRINRTNLAVTLPDGRTLTEALAARDMLVLRHGVLNAAVASAADRPSRYSLSEIRRVTTVPVGELRRELDALAQARRELDGAIQATNWTEELLD